MRPSRSTASLDEPDGLRDAEPGTVEELDERTVARGTRRRPVRGLDETLGLGRGEGARDGSRTPGACDRRRRVVRTRADQGEMAEVGTDGCESPGDRRGRSSVGAHRREPGLDLLGRRVADRVRRSWPRTPRDRAGTRRRCAASGGPRGGAGSSRHRGRGGRSSRRDPIRRRRAPSCAPNRRRTEPVSDTSAVNPDNADCVPIRPQPMRCWRRHRRVSSSVARRATRRAP